MTNNAHTQNPPSTDKTAETAQQVIASCKAQISAIGSSTKELATDLAKLRDRFGMTQAAIADAVSKKQPWVSHMLAWYDDDFNTDTPFGETSKAARKRAKARPAKYQATDKSSSGDAGASTSEPSKSKPTTSTSGTTTQPKKGSPEWQFNEAVYFFDHTLSKMDDANFARAMAMFNERRGAAKAVRPPVMASPAVVKIGKETMKSLDGFSEAAKRQIAVAGDDVDTEASTEQRTAAYTASEANRQAA